MLTINYNYYEDNFNQTLISELRKHGSSEEYLQLWVPDDNIVIGLAGMVDSVLASKITDFHIQVAKRSISQNQIDEFINLIKSTSHCKHSLVGDLYNFEFSPAQLIGKSPSPDINKKITKSKVEIKKLQESRSGVEKSQPIILPDLEEAALMLKVNLEHEVALKNIQNCISISTLSYVLYLKVGADGLVHEAYFHSNGELWSKNLLDLYCQLARGIPFQEVADHNVLKIIDELKLRGNKSLSDGILLPTNCGSFFTELIIACRKVYADWAKENQSSRDINQYISPPNDYWQKTDPTVLLDKIKNHLNDYYKEKNLIYSELISGIRLEKNKSKYLVRTVIQYASNAMIDRPSDLLGIENYLRIHLEKTLEVVSERVSDTSPLRRLTK